MTLEASFTSKIRRYYDLELPSPQRGRKLWPLLIALHGYEGDKGSMMRVARRIAAGRMIVISLQGHHQFFKHYGKNDLTDTRKYPVVFGWGTSYRMDESIDVHHEAIRRLIRLAVRHHRVDPARVFLLGFSQACAYNYRFVFTYPKAICGAISVCGGVPGDWYDNPRFRRARTHVLHIAATHDVWYSRARNLENKARLAERVASLDFRFYKSEHRFPRRAIPHIRKWIESHLR
jgi:predicted esterase